MLSSTPSKTETFILQVGAAVIFHTVLMITSKRWSMNWAEQEVSNTRQDFILTGKQGDNRLILTGSLIYSGRILIPCIPHRAPTTGMFRKAFKSEQTLLINLFIKKCMLLYIYLKEIIR